jgi:hypothetical protein
MGRQQRVVCFAHLSNFLGEGGMALGMCLHANFRFVSAFILLMPCYVSGFGIMAFLFVFACSGVYLWNVVSS